MQTKNVDGTRFYGYTEFINSQKAFYRYFLCVKFG